MFTDITESELQDYRSSQVDPGDFDQFWAASIEQSREHDVNVVIDKIPTPLVNIDVYDVTFAGFDGQPIKAWLRLPHGTQTPPPVVVQYVSYGGGRGRAVENLLWASAGYAHFQMDTRGQGSEWSIGDTPDDFGGGPQSPGFMTRGVESRENYYYRRVFIDAVRAIDAVRSIDLVDSSRIAVIGHSQGGGIALAVAGLVPDLSAAIAYAPLLCDFPRAIVITDHRIYREISQYLAVHRHDIERVNNTLAYFDGVNFAKRASAPIWISVGMMDDICPPSTIFGAFHEYSGDKNIKVWTHNGHEVGGVDDDIATLEAFSRVLRPT